MGLWRRMPFCHPQLLFAADALLSSPVVVCETLGQPNNLLFMPLPITDITASFLLAAKGLLL